MVTSPLEIARNEQLIVHFLRKVNSWNPRTGNPFFEILSFHVSFARVLTNQISVDKNIFYAVALSLHEEQRDEKRPSGDKLSKILQGGGAARCL